MRTLRLAALDARPAAGRDAGRATAEGRRTRQPARRSALPLRLEQARRDVESMFDGQPRERIVRRRAIGPRRGRPDGSCHVFSRTADIQCQTRRPAGRDDARRRSQELTVSWASSISSKANCSRSSSGPTTRATRSPGAFPTKTRPSRTARRSSCASRRSRSSSTSASSATPSSPGKHSLTTDNIPILTKIKSWPYGFESPFKADVYFVVTRLFTGNKWGTSNPIMLRDADFGVVRVRAFGTYDFKVVDAKRSCAKSPAPTTTSASTSSPTRCARASSASLPTRSRRRRFPCSTSRRATPSSATRCCRSSTLP